MEKCLKYIQTVRHRVVHKVGHCSDLRYTDVRFMCIYCFHREYSVCACTNSFVTLYKPVYFNTRVIANFLTMLLLLLPLPSIDGVSEMLKF